MQDSTWWYDKVDFFPKTSKLFQGCTVLSNMRMLPTSPEIVNIVRREQIITLYIVFTVKTAKLVRWLQWQMISSSVCSTRSHPSEDQSPRSLSALKSQNTHWAWLTCEPDCYKSYRTIAEKIAISDGCHNWHFEQMKQYHMFLWTSLWIKLSNVLSSVYVLLILLHCVSKNSIHEICMPSPWVKSMNTSVMRQDAPRG